MNRHIHSAIINSILKKTSLAQTDLARLLNVDPQLVNDWKLGKTPIHEKHWGMLLKLNTDLTGKDFMGC